MHSMVAATLAGVGILASGCHKSPEHASAPELPSVAVRATEAAAGVHRATDEVVGTVRARVQATIEAKVVGRIARITATPGATVKAGDTLVELDAAEMQARVDQARAVLQQADRDLERMASLLKSEAVTRAEFDAMESRQRIARASLSEAETLLGYVRVVAPFAGQVTRKLAEVGDLAAPGRPLLELEDNQALRFEADVPMSLLGRVRLGDRLPVTLESGPTAIEGVVGEIEPTAHAATRTFRVKLDLPKGTEARAGHFGRMAVPTAESTMLAVPTNAVLVRGQMELAFVVVEGRAQLRLVKTGKRVGDRVEILSGIDRGERVVVGGLAALADGQPVTVQ